MKKEKMLVTGSTGMIGKALIPILLENNYEVLAPTKDEMNCLVLQSCYDYFDKHQPDYVIHLSGFNGGISFNAKYPADIYMQTAWMALSVLGAASFYSKKVVSVLPSCAYYPYYRRLTIEDGMTKDVDEIPAELLCEKEFESGEPHESVACHGLSKRILFDYSRQLAKQFKFNAVCCVLNNCYGPGCRANEQERMKVLDSLVQKFVLAKREKLEYVEIWGDGSPLREFTYCKDAAEGILHVFKYYDDPTEVINIGPGTEISIKDLAFKIKEIIGYSGELVFDNSKNNGQLRKRLDCTKFSNIKPQWHPRYTIEEGIKETVCFFENRLTAAEEAEGQRLYKSFRDQIAKGNTWGMDPAQDR